MNDEEFFEWTKRLGQRHYARVGFETMTLCGMPMLGNNYAEIILDEDKTDCDVCIVLKANKETQR